MQNMVRYYKISIERGEKNIMEKIKMFLSKPKNTVTLGLIGSFLLICLAIISNSYLFEGKEYLNFIIYSCFEIGIFTYFAIIFLKEKKILNIETLIGQNILIVGVFLLLLSYFQNIMFNKFLLVQVICLSIIIVYLLKIFKIVEWKVNNKLFVVACIFLLICSEYYLWFKALIFIAELLVIPYFYNYNNLYREKEKKNVDKETNGKNIKQLIIYLMIALLIYTFNDVSNAGTHNISGLYMLDTLRLFFTPVIMVILGILGIIIYINKLGNKIKEPKGLLYLSFFIPLVGLILYCVHIRKNEALGKACGKLTIIGWLFPFIMIIPFIPIIINF